MPHSSQAAVSDRLTGDQAPFSVLLQHRSGFLENFLGHHAEGGRRRPTELSRGGLGVFRILSALLDSHLCAVLLRSISTLFSHGGVENITTQLLAVSIQESICASLM